MTKITPVILLTLGRDAVLKPSQPTALSLHKILLPVGFFEGLLASIFPAQHRFAPVMAAAVLGVMVGFSTLQPPATPDAAEMLNFKVFKPKVIALSSITPNYERL
jgi:hypothetical protein